ncbi:MAG: glycosyltransferase [Candidatus Moraniibacteriota bacterium]
MNLFLIKIGKAWSVLRRDGFRRGGRRIYDAFIALFHRVHQGEILFITGGVGDSARYRTEHVTEELRLQGFSVSITVQDNPFLASYADKFSVFVFHRVLYTPSVAKLITRIKDQDKEIIFETDDLVYDPEFLKHMDYFTKMNTWEKKLYEHGVGGEILADPYVCVATTTTSFLAEKLRGRGKQVFVVKNKLSKQDVLWAEQVVEKKSTSYQLPATQLIRIGYLSGTPSHNKDFATITQVFVEIFEHYPEVRLVLAGPLDTESVLQRYADRIERVAFVPRSELFGVIASLDINLAPLEIGNPFCESKSELKWFEAGIVGVPTVAAATEPFRQAIADGVDGYVAATEAEWQEKLEKLITDPEARRQMGEQARQTVRSRYTTVVADNREYYEYLRSKMSSRTCLPAAGGIRDLE